jgi:putative tryptophan/tyrosine transport system substrate-binding protein
MKMNPNKQYNKKYHLLLFILLVVTSLFINGCNEKKPKVYRVGILSGAKVFDNIADGFVAKMTELGYANSRNIIYDHQKASLDMVACKNTIMKFITDKVDLILVFPTEPALVVKATTLGMNIPIVFAMAGIEGNNLVDSVSCPGGNITGVRYPGPEHTVRRLDILVELVPQARKIYLIYDQNYPNTPMALEGLRSAASSLGITLVEDPVNTMEEFRFKLEARSALRDIGIDAILLMPDILNNSHDGFKAIQNFASKHKLPVGGGMAFTADFGALFSFVPDNIEQGKLAAVMADKIFNGKPAGKIMLASPKARLRINYNVIKKLGLTVSDGLLSRADEIIR